MKKLFTTILVLCGLLLSALPVRAQQRFTVIQDTFRINAADYFNPISTIRIYNIKYITIWHIIFTIWFLKVAV